MSMSPSRSRCAFRGAQCDARIIAPGPDFPGCRMAECTIGESGVPRQSLAVLLWCAADALAQTAGAGNRTAASASKVALLKQGRALLEANDIARAQSYIDAALQRDPASAEAHFLLGLLKERQKDFPAAAAAYTKTIGYAPRMAEAHDRLGFVLGQQGQTREAHPPVRRGGPARSGALRRAVPPRRHALVDAGFRRRASRAAGCRQAAARSCRGPLLSRPDAPEAADDSSPRSSSCATRSG